MRRPAITVSNDAANGGTARLASGTVAPLKSNKDSVYPFQVLVRAVKSGLERSPKAQAEQICAVAVSRIGPRIGQVSAFTVATLDEAVRIHLGPA